MPSAIGALLLALGIAGCTAQLGGKNAHLDRAPAAAQVLADLDRHYPADMKFFGRLRRGGILLVGPPATVDAAIKSAMVVVVARI